MHLHCIALPASPAVVDMAAQFPFHTYLLYEKCLYLIFELCIHLWQLINHKCAIYNSSLAIAHTSWALTVRRQLELFRHTLRSTGRSAYLLLPGFFFCVGLPPGIHHPNTRLPLRIYKWPMQILCTAYYQYRKYTHADLRAHLSGNGGKEARTFRQCIRFIPMGSNK